VDGKFGYKLSDPWKYSEETLGVVVPILRQRAPEREYVTMYEVLKDLGMKDTGRIDQVELQNRTGKAVFVRAGTIFAGATQSRAAQHSGVYREVNENRYIITSTVTNNIWRTAAVRPEVIIIPLPKVIPFVFALLHTFISHAIDPLPAPFSVPGAFAAPAWIFLRHDSCAAARSDNLVIGFWCDVHHVPQQIYVPDTQHYFIGGQPSWIALFHKQNNFCTGHYTP